MTNKLNIVQFECTVESSFDLIEKTFDMVRNAMAKEPSLQDALEVVAMRLFGVWQQKLRQELTPFACDDLFSHTIQASMKIYLAMLRKNHPREPEVINLPKVRAIFGELVVELIKYEQPN